MTSLTQFRVAVACIVIIACSPTAIHSGGAGGGGGRGRGATRCPTDVREEIRGYLHDYEERLDALEQSGERFFPGLDVEIIRALCSLWEEAIRRAKDLNEACQQTELRTIEEELSPHVGVSQLCQKPQFYEEYAINQNCFSRIRSESELCDQSFQQSVRNDERAASRSSSSSSSSSSANSQRHHAQQQRQYCNHVSQLIACVKSHVRLNPSSCSKNALTLVGHLVRASMTSSVVCSDEQSATSSSAPGQAHVVNQSEDSTSGGSVATSFRFWHFLLVAVSLYFTSALPLRRRRRNHRHHLEQQRLNLEASSSSSSLLIIK